LPAWAHSLEFMVHWLRGTVLLRESIAASIAFSIVSTAFNLFAMRRGALIVGPGSRSIWSDLMETPRLIVAFVATMTGVYRPSPRR